MHWLINDLNHGLEQLKRWQTWLVIGIIGLFIGLAYAVMRFSFQTDAILLFLHRAGGACRELNNAAIIFLFCGMMFFMFSAVVTLGEFQRFFESRSHAAHREAGQAMRWAIFWTCVTVGIAISALVFFARYCR